MKPNADTGSPTAAPRREREAAGALVPLVEELVAGWNARDARRVGALHAPEYEGVDVASAAPHLGPRGVVLHAEAYLRAFPDLRLSQDDVIVEGERAVLVWTARGTHGGELMRIPPTGRAVEVRGVSVLETKDGRISRGLHVWDVAGFLRNIGLLPRL